MAELAIIFGTPLALFLLAVVIGAMIPESYPPHHRKCECGRCERARIARKLKRGW